MKDNKLELLSDTSLDYETAKNDKAKVRRKRE